MKVFKMITDEVIADVHPSKENLAEYFKSKSNKPTDTDWSQCPPIKSSGDMFSFQPILAKTILHVL